MTHSRSFDPPLGHRGRVRFARRHHHWLTLREVAAELGLSYEATRDRYREGRFRSVRVAQGRRGGRPQVLVSDCCVQSEKEQSLCDCTTEVA